MLAFYSNIFLCIFFFIQPCFNWLYHFYVIAHFVNPGQLFYTNISRGRCRLYCLIYHQSVILHFGFNCSCLAKHYFSSVGFSRSKCNFSLRSHLKVIDIDMVHRPNLHNCMTSAVSKALRFQRLEKVINKQELPSDLGDNCC